MTRGSLARPSARPYAPAAAAFRAGSDTPRAFLERTIAAIAASEQHVLAFVALNLEAARAAADASAERWQAGRPRSPIDGMPVGIKDIIETADMPTGNGSALFTGHHTYRDSATVKALRDAGAVVIGKTVTTEFAATEPGPTRNPWDLSRTPGGSSSGSAAAVAAGFCSAALGTQVVGSILRPASYCGVIGYKPTVGAINRGGSHDALSQSAHGVIAATLPDTWLVAREIGTRAGGDPGFPGLFGPDDCPAPRRPQALALLETEGWAMAGPDARAALHTAVETLRRSGIEVRSRRQDPAVEAVEVAIGTTMALTRRINAFESRWPLNTYRDRDATKLSQSMIVRASEAEALSLEDYRTALALREATRSTYAGLAAAFAGCITLTAPSAAPVGLSATGNAVFVVAGSLLGVPTLSLPLLACEELPLGLQVLGFKDRDADLFAIAGHVASVVGQANAVSATTL